MRLEAVIICKDYDDFLAETLPLNLPQFDDVVVVTHPNDKATQAVCAKNSVECVMTTAFHENGDAFNKGRGINIGMDHLKREDWIIHLDADIILPHGFRNLLAKTKLDPKNIYGADRVNVYGWDSWQKLKPKMNHHYQNRWFIDPGFCHENKAPEGCKFGARVVHMEYGWIPIGFFQLFHSSSGARYNYKRGAAAGTDIMFPNLWPRENRILMPEVICYHLDSEDDHKIGTNWKGRRSRRFGPHHGGKECHEHHGHHHHKHYCEKQEK